MQPKGLLEKVTADDVNIGLSVTSVSGTALATRRIKKLERKKRSFSRNIHSSPRLMDEIKVLEECKCIGLPNFIPRSAFVSILTKRLDAIHARPVEFMRDMGLRRSCSLISHQQIL